MATNWAAIPSDIIRSIAQWLHVSDHARLRAVCTCWASALKDFVPTTSHFPWLILMHPLDRDGKLSVFSPVEKRYYHLPHFPKICRYCVIGYKDGWLVILHETLNLWLVNPLNGAQIHLPRFCKLSEFDDHPFKYVNKVVLSNSPASNNFVAIAIYNSWQSLAYARPENSTWTPIYILPKGIYIEDIVYHIDRFFVISKDGQVHTFSLSGPYLESSLFMNSLSSNSGQNGYNHNSYLVSTSSRELLYVKKSITNKEIKVMKFDPQIQSCWVETKDLGDQALFLDGKYSMSVSTRDDPELKTNCIYIINENLNSIRNVVRFHVESRFTWPCFSLNIHYNRMRSLRPIWIEPSLLGTHGTSITVGSKMYRSGSLFPESHFQ